MHKIRLAFLLLALVTIANSRISRRRLAIKRQIFDTIDFTSGYNARLSPKQVKVKGYVYTTPEKPFDHTYVPPSSTTSRTFTSSTTPRSTTTRPLSTPVTTSRTTTTRSTTRSTTPYYTPSTPGKTYVTPSSTRPTSTRPSSTRPSSTRPSSTRPSSTRPSSTRTSSTRPTTRLSTPGSTYIIPTSGPTRKPTTFPTLKPIPPYTGTFPTYNFSTYNYTFTGTYPTTPYTMRPFTYTTTRTTGYVYTKPADNEFTIEDVRGGYLPIK